jgi:prepilin-type N-terminal cleavage/methylation domain-containing protein
MGQMAHHQDGMTLIEVIASIALLSVVILTFAYVFIQSQQFTTMNGDRQTALQLAQKKLSETLAGPLPEQNTSEVPFNPDVPDSWIRIDYRQEPNSAYRTFTFKKLPDSPESDPGRPLMIMVRTYYDREHHYIELYNYYTTN